ncbi:MAG: HAMP domain-containing protein, partial [Planctomycetota bacterium]
MSPFPISLTISSKLRILSAVFAVFLGASAVFTSRAIEHLSRDGSIRERVSLQMAALYELNLLLSREIEGQPVRQRLEDSLRTFQEREGELSALRESNASSVDDNPTSDPETMQYVQGIAEALRLADRRRVTFDHVTEALTPLSAAFASLERKLSAIDDDEYEYHLESCAEARDFLNSLRGPLHKLVALPDGEELAQTELAIRVLTERTLTTAEALHRGSEDLELDPLADTEVAETSDALLEQVTRFSASITELVDVKVTLAKHRTALGGTLDSCVSELADINSATAVAASQYQMNARRFTAVLALASLVLTAVLFFFGRYLSRSLIDANDIAAEIAGGNLDQTIDGGRKDEIGDLFDELAHMQANLRDSREEVEEQLAANRAKSDDLEKLHGAQLQQAQILEEALKESERLAKADAERAAEDLARARALESKVSDLLGVVER